jgi:hypothetical protein
MGQKYYTSLTEGPANPGKSEPEQPDEHDGCAGIYAHSHETGFDAEIRLRSQGQLWAEGPSSVH